MSCTPQQCAELEALRLVLEAEKAAILAEAELLTQELVEVNASIDLVNGCIDDCECNQAVENPGEEGNDGRKAMSKEQRARVDMLLRLTRMVRKNPPKLG